LPKYGAIPGNGLAEPLEGAAIDAQDARGQQVPLDS